jgi:uncharacterized protein (DUF1800 family)
VEKVGWEAWFEQQLHPNTISDPAADKRLAQYPALNLHPQQLAVEFPDNQAIVRIVNGKQPMPTDPQLAAVYEVLIARYQKSQAQNKAAAAMAGSSTAAAPHGTVAAPNSVPAMNPSQAPASPPAMGAGSSAPPAAQAAMLTPEQAAAQLDAQKKQEHQQEQADAKTLADQILLIPKANRMQAILALPVEQRMVLPRVNTEPERSMLLNDLSPHDRELFMIMALGNGGNGAVVEEMQEAKLVRAVVTERQLQDVMTDFWVNHFNIDLGKIGNEVYYGPSYERDAIRAHALGKFRDLLLATAEHPAMLIYLDNWLSIGPESQAAGRPRPGAKNGGQKGLNENYGREVMELHTVGVDGGYSQADVTSLAQIMTGWTVDQPQFGGPFLFDPKKHEPGPKEWFGHKVNEGGMEEGVEAMKWLAAQPQTAHFLSYELAQRLVSDTPPPALVDRMAAAYMSSDGDISTVLRAMVHSPEFFARANYRNKVKMPLEYVASTLRATDTDPSNATALVNQLRNMGEPPYRCLPPTGYQPTADHWMNSSALVDRLNYALQLTGSQFGGMHFDASRLLAAGLLSRPAGAAPAAVTHTVALHGAPAEPGGKEEALRLMEGSLIGGVVSDKTNAVIRQQLEAAPAPQPATPAAGTTPASLPVLAEPWPDPTQTLDKLAAMILGSPEFQVH